MNAFDLESTVYDDTFTHTTIGKNQRSNVYAYLEPILDCQSKLDILELNCGTGVDALHMHKYGHRITATDNSAGMMEVAQMRFNENNANISVDLIDLSNGISGSKSYDLIFSNFGGLNCISNKKLIHLATSIFEHLVDGGSFIAVIMPRHSIVEKMYRWVKGQSEIYTQRSTTSPIRVNVNEGMVDTFYFNPSDMERIFHQFKIISTRPIGFLPSYLEKSKYRTIWNSINSVLTRLPISSKYADHFLMHLIKP